MSETASNNKRIAKNTLFLYFRMMFIMLITLYTSRVVLDKLGIVDYGINNVVGGLAGMFTFFSSSLANASQRFLNIELGKKDVLGAQRVFNQHFVIYLCFIAAVLLLAETVGLWFVLNKLVIPPERLTAAIWVYQFTIISLCVTLLGIIFNSVIIAHEDMKVYSYIGIYEGIAKLLIAFAISIVPFDRLICYAALLMCVSLSTQIFYACHCFKHYQECKLNLCWEKNAFKETFPLISWNLVGTAVYAINHQGTNLLLNMFFGPVVNAARAVSMQINHAIMNFGTSFYTSVRPQITKSYAAGDFEYMNKLFFYSSKYSVFLLWMLCLPVMLNIEQILHIWLVDIPEYTGIFTIWILAYSMVDILNNPIWSIALSVGKLKKYISIGSSVFLCAFPISYVCLKMGTSPTSVFIILFLVRLVYLFVVIKIIRTYISFSLKEYLHKVILKSLGVLTISGLLSLVIGSFMPQTFIGLILNVGVCLFVIASTIWFLGVNRKERITFKTAILKKLTFVKK